VALDIFFDQILVEPDIVDGGHHARHRDRPTAADGEQQRRIGRAEYLAVQTLDLIECGPDPTHEIFPGLGEAEDDIAAAEDLGGDDKGRRHRLAVRYQGGKIIPLVAEVDEIMGERVEPVQQGDGLVGIVGHQQVEPVLVEDGLLVLQGLNDAQDEIVEMLQAEGRGDQVAEKGLRQPLHRGADLALVVQAHEFRQKVLPTDLGE